MFGVLFCAQFWPLLSLFSLGATAVEIIARWGDPVSALKVENILWLTEAGRRSLEQVRWQPQYEISGYDYIKTFNFILYLDKASTK